MNNSIVMDIILSLSLIFIYYIYTKFDKEIEVVIPNKGGGGRNNKIKAMDMVFID